MIIGYYVECSGLNHAQRDLLSHVIVVTVDSTVSWVGECILQQ